MAETTRLEGVYTIRLENGPALQQLERLTKELFDVRAEKTSLTKETRNLIKEEKNLEAEIKRTGAATEDQAKRLADVRKRREENNRAVAEAIAVERGLSSQTRELNNDLSGLTATGQRFRDKMSDAFTKALEGSNVFQQLGTRAEFLEMKLKEGAAAMETQQQQIAELNAQLQAGAKTEEEYAAEMRVLNEEIAKSKTGNEALQTELAGVTEKTNKLDAEIKELNEQYRKGEIDQAQYREGLAKIEAETKKAGDATGALTSKFDAFVQGQGKELKSTLSSLALQYVGIGAAITGFTRLIGDSVETIKVFEQRNANLASILGKSRSEITALTDSAIALAPALGRLPEEVTELQTELAKLGFTEEQILDTQEAVILLANATGEELGPSAELLAGTLKAMGLEASESQRVVDVMAESFNKTSLDLSKFGTAMSTVAPVARAAGIGIEEVTATVGTLSDANIDASTIGTSLRDIFIDLAAKGITMDDALQQINASTDKLSTANELFGKRSATVALVLAENVEKTDELTTSFENAGGAAEKMANEQLNTLDGALNKLSGSWDALTLQGGGISSFFAEVVNGASLALQALSGLSEEQPKIEAFTASVQKQFERLGGAGKLAAEEGSEAVERFRFDAEAIASEKDVDLILARAHLIRDRLRELSDQGARLKAERDGGFNPERNRAAIEQNRIEQAAALAAQDAAHQRLQELGRINVAENDAAIASKKSAETIAQARDRITAAIATEKAALSELDVTNTQGIEQSNLRIATLERELSAIDGKITKTKQLSESERKHLELQREMQALANEAPTAIAGIGAGDIAARAATPVPTQQPDQFGIIDTSRLESAVDTTTGLLEQYDREQEAFQNLQDAKLGAVEGFANAFGQLAAKGSNAAQFLFAIEKAAAIAQVIVNGIREVSAITAIYPIGTPLTPVALAAIAAAKIRTATSVAAIGAQAIAGFAEGGEIGPSGTVTSTWGTPITRANGDNVLVRAGGSFVTLRTGEKVLNEDQQRELERRTHKQIWGDIGLPGYTSSMTDFRRSQYLAGFADGGEIIGSITPRPSPATIVQNQVVSSLTDYAERPVYVDVREVTSTQRRVEVQETRSSL